MLLQLTSVLGGMYDLPRTLVRAVPVLLAVGLLAPREGTAAGEWTRAADAGALLLIAGAAVVWGGRVRKAAVLAERFRAGGGGGRFLVILQIRQDRFVADPRHMAITPERLLADDYIGGRRALIRAERAMTEIDPDRAHRQRDDLPGGRRRGGQHGLLHQQPFQLLLRGSRGGRIS